MSRKDDAQRNAAHEQEAAGYGPLALKAVLAAALMLKRPEAEAKAKKAA